MTTFPGSPRLLKGAIIGLDALGRPDNVIVFQYNPETTTRRLDARTTGGGDNSDRSEALRLIGPPRETITLSGLEIDASDQLELGSPLALASGVYPTLAALEMLLYPASAKVMADFVLAQAGNIEIIPPEAPLTLFVWGLARVLPVRLTSFSITEEAFDPLLNPIRAKVDLTLQVLSYVDLKLGTPGHNLYLAHQIAKEVLAASNVISSGFNLATSVNLR